jgi:ferredoxin
MSARVRVDLDKCVGHGRCYVLAPEVFGEDERGYCVISRAELPAELESAARLGADNCPEHAITVEEG